MASQSIAKAQIKARNPHQVLKEDLFFGLHLDYPLQALLHLHWLWEAEVCQPWGTACLSPSLQVWRPCDQLPNPLALRSAAGASKTAKPVVIATSHGGRTARHSPTSASPRYFQSQASAPRIITFPKSLFIQHHQTGATRVLLCVGHASMLAQLLLQLQPCASLLLALPRWVSLQLSSPRLPGCQAGERARGQPAGLLVDSTTNFLLGKAELSSYFLSNPKNSLYQFTFPRLSWQGIVPESYFF